MKIFEQIEGLASDCLGIVKTVISIAKLETRLAGLSVYPLLLNIGMLLIVLMTIWMSAMLGLGYFFTLTFGSAVMALIFVLLINVGFFILLLSYLKFNLKNMSFEKTREYFSKKRENENDKLKKTSHCSNCNDGKKIKISPN